MSASLTMETVEVSTLGAVVDRLGYTRCVACWGDQLVNEAGATWVDLGDLGDPATCDGCERLIRDCPPLRSSATVVVEHVTCKIF